MQELDEKIKNYGELEAKNKQELRNISCKEDRYNHFCEVKDKYLGSRNDTILGTILFIGSITSLVLGGPLFIVIGVVELVVSLIISPFAIHDFKKTKKELRRFYPLNKMSQKELKDYTNKLIDEKESVMRRRRILNKWQDYLDKEVEKTSMSLQSSSIIQEAEPEEQLVNEKPMQKVKKIEYR